MIPGVIKICIGIVQVEVIIELIIRVRESNRLEALDGHKMSLLDNSSRQTIMDEAIQG